jgi:hypothetical protein
VPRPSSHPARFSRGPKWFPVLCAEHPGVLLQLVDDGVKQVGGSRVLGVQLVMDLTHGSNGGSEA